jgi:hypothetical protein
MGGVTLEGLGSDDGCISYIQREGFRFHVVTADHRTHP